MTLIEKTIEVLSDTEVDGVSMLDHIHRSRDLEHGTWPFSSTEKVEAAMLTAASQLPPHQLSEEYNELAAFFGCDPIDEWEYQPIGLSLEMFIDEVLSEIVEMMNHR